MSGKIELITNNDDWVIIRNGTTGAIYYSGHPDFRGQNLLTLLSAISCKETEVIEVTGETMEEACGLSPVELSNFMQTDKWEVNSET